MSENAEKLERFVANAGQLFSLPAVAIEVLRLTGQPKVDMSALKRCIENDPALTTRILRVVNSSLFGLACEVSDLNQALALLGLTPLKLLVLGFSLADPAFCQMTGGAMDRYWRHTLTKAVAARELSQSLWRMPGDEPFIAALLQDLGQLVLLQQLGAPYSVLLEKVLVAQADLATTEREALGFDHTELTAHLLTAWGLPGSLAETVRARSAEEVLALPSPARSLPQIVHLAGLLADLVVDNRQDVLPHILHVGVDRKLNSPALMALVVELQEKVEQLAEVFALQLPAGYDYQQVLVKAQSELSSVAADAAIELLNLSRTRGETEAALLDEVRALNSAADQFLRRGGLPQVVPRQLAPQPKNELPGPGENAARAGAALAAARLDDPATLTRKLATAVAACRQARCALSLALVEVDHLSQWLLDVPGHNADTVLGEVERLCAQLDVPGMARLAAGPNRVAVVLPRCDREEAVALAGELVRSAGAIGRGAARPLTLSVGVATVALPHKDFSPAELTAAAGRCLAAAQKSGNCAKSIGIY